MAIKWYKAPVIGVGPLIGNPSQVQRAKVPESDKYDEREK